MTRAGRVPRDGLFQERARMVESVQALLPTSAPLLRRAVPAASMGHIEHIAVKIDAIERLHLDELTALDDSAEGLRAFMEKRKRLWRDS